MTRAPHLRISDVTVRPFLPYEVFDPDFKPQISEAATAGVPLEITFWTRGLRCDRGGDTSVVVNGRAAAVTPYEYQWHGGCPDLGAIFEHKARVVFEDPGTSQIVLVSSEGYSYLARVKPECSRTGP